MKRKLYRTIKEITKRLTTGLCILAIFASGFPTGPSSGCAATATPAATKKTTPPPGESANAPQIKVNRTVPQVTPPKPGLEFSASPTPEDFFRSRMFEEPLVPVGGEPSRAENVALASALLRYSKRAGPDDFTGLTGFLETHPKSAWCAALLLDLGLEYYNTAHYSLALDVWAKSWALARDAGDSRGKAIGDRAAGELAFMYARLGRMTELDALLKAVEGRVFVGPATEKISGARAGLSNMKERPEIAFRCGPLALHRIKVSLDPKNAGIAAIYDSASTQNGFSLPQVAELSKKVGLNYQMAFRERRSDFIVPSVVHWKVGHYAAMIRRDGDRYLLQDPTFQNDVWVTKDALEAEACGFFIVPPGDLARGWRAVETTEGGKVWGKGNTQNNDNKNNNCSDHKSGGGSCQQGDDCQGMAVPSVHLMLVSLNLRDEPVGYSPPVGPAVRFKVRYNQREAYQPGAFSYSNFGPKWTFDWLSYIKDNPLSPSSDVQFFNLGGGTRLFTGFDPVTQTYAYQQYEQTRLTRTAPDRYEMLSPDGSKKVFSQPDGSTATSRKVFLTQIIDPFGNALNLTYDASLRLVAVTDAIGQVSTLSYDLPGDTYKITKVTDPFDRFATFAYDSSGRLTNITDVIGLNSQFTYEGSGDFINSLITPYGITSFTKGENGTTRWLETVYPDGERDRVEFNQSINLGIPFSIAPSEIPVGMNTQNAYLWFRNTYYWSKIACAQAYGDYTKAKIYHWLHTADLASTAGILESTKEALEGRVWYDYPDQNDPILVGSNNKATHMGRVLDDGSTQLYSYEYNGFGNVTKMIDPVGRTFSYIYSTNGIDLLEVRQTRAGNNELLSKKTYNGQHLAITMTDAADQTSTNTYNARGQLATASNPKGESTSYTYDVNGYLRAIDGPLSGTSDSITFTYDDLGHLRTVTDSDGYVFTLEHDGSDRPTKITRPDGSFERFTYDRLDLATYRDRAGRQTTFEHNNVRQLTRRTDPLNRLMIYQWCQCGSAKSVTDPIGRTTTWRHDLQGRESRKELPDGSVIAHLYENATSRLRQKVDEKLQITDYRYNQDDTLSTISYLNAAVPTPSVTFTYDPNYLRIASMVDGAGVARYTYYRITDSPNTGAGQLAAMERGPQQGTVSLAYDQLGRVISRKIDGVAYAWTYDAGGRVVTASNALGAFSYTYDASSRRLASFARPNGLNTLYSYLGNSGDHQLSQIANTVGVTPVSAFTYDYDIPRGRITRWSQQADVLPPLVYTFGYDAADRLILANGTNAGVAVEAFTYTYDLAGNRLSQQTSVQTNLSSYNALNELTSLSGRGLANATYEWDAAHRLSAVTMGSQRTEFTYDGNGRRTAIRDLTNGVEISDRRFVWCGSDICEERTAAGQVAKRFYPQGVKVEGGPAAGQYYYTRDHLGSIREMLDAAGGSVGDSITIPSAPVGALPGIWMPILVSPDISTTVPPPSICHTIAPTTLRWADGCRKTQ